MSKSTDTALWREAIALCQEFQGQDTQDVLQALHARSLRPELLEKVIKILGNMSASNPLLDENNYQDVINQLSQGKHLIGKSIDGYAITRLIAKGGMSAVYEAIHQDSEHQKPVALKLLSPYGITEKAIELFQREQLILSKLSHPSIVSFHHSGLTEDGTHYLVMEYIDQAKDVVEYAQGLQTAEKVKLIVNLCDVFAYAHDKEVIHRDIKPGNVLVNGHGQVKVIDFGIGRLEQMGTQTMTQVFTPDAAAPEQLMGQGVSRQTDVFSLGALLLQMLVHAKPLPKTNVKTYHPDNDTRHINALLKASGLDADLQNIVRTATHVDPDKRYPDMQTFGRDLERWLAAKPVSASPDSWWYRLSKWVKRNQMVSGLLLLLVILGAGTWGLLQIKESQNQNITAQKERTFALLKAMLQQADPVKNPELADNEAFIRHLKQLTTSQAAVLDSDPELKAFYYNELGEIYHNKGLYDESLASYETVYAAQLEYLTPQDDAVLGVRNSINHLLETTDLHQEALAAAHTLLADLDTMDDPHPRHRLNTYYLMMKVLQYQYENDDALAVGQKALAWMEQHPEINPSLQASVLNSLAVINRVKGQVDIAESLYGEAIALLRPLPNELIQMTSIMVNLAILKGRGGDYEASEAIFNKAIESLKRVDPKHPHLAMTYLPYSTLLRYTGRYDESIEKIQEAIPILVADGTDKHLATAYERLARMQLVTEDLDAVGANLVKSLQLKRAIYAVDHPEILDLYVMALWLLAEQDPAAALAIANSYAQHEVSKVLETDGYAQLQWISAWLEGRVLVNQREASVLTYFEHTDELTDAASRRQWLQQELAKQKETDGILGMWLRSQLWALGESDSGLGPDCRFDATWFRSSYVLLKRPIWDACLAQTGLDDGFVQTAAQALQSVPSPASIQQVVDAFTAN